MARRSPSSAEEGAPSAGLVAVPKGPILPYEERWRATTAANREFTFGFLLGYLSLALHATLEYSRFAGYYVSPWELAEPRPDEPLVRIWSTRVGQRSSYRPEAALGEVAVVLSDGLAEPREALDRLGAFPEGDGPPHRWNARTRVPRVDLVTRPSEGHAYEMSDLAREVAERFRRALD